MGFAFLFQIKPGWVFTTMFAGLVSNPNIELVPEAEAGHAAGGEGRRRQPGGRIVTQVMS